MLFDGQKRAKEIREGLKANCRAGELVVVSVEPIPESMVYMRMKQKVGEQIGVNVRIDTVAADTVTDAVQALAEDESVAGIVVQLPLPEHVDIEAVLANIPPHKDPDALSPTPMVVSPVARAVMDIIAASDVDLTDAEVVVIGRGGLVGQPVANLFYALGVHLTVVDIETDRNEFEAALKVADVIVSGAGSPGLIQPHMIKRGCVLIDAGTSEAGGKIVGDAEPECEEVASLMTPVPGGVGPLAVTMLFANLCDLCKGTEL